MKIKLIALIALSLLSLPVYALTGDSCCKPQANCCPGACCTADCCQQHASCCPGDCCAKQ